MTTLELTHQIVGLRPALHMFTRRFTANREESLDLVQDTLVKALSYRDTFRENTNLQGWLFTIMRNTFINNYRRRKRAMTMLDNTKELYVLNKEDHYTFNKPDKSSEYSDILKLIDSLPQEFLQPFALHIRGYKYHEIAEELTIPIGTVKNRIFQARKEIQKRLTGY